MNSPIRKYINEYSGEYTDLMRHIIADIIKALRGYRQDPTIVVESIFRKYGVDDKLRKKIYSAIGKSLLAGSGMTGSGIALERWYLGNVYNPNGVKFSGKTSDLTRQDEIVAIIRQALATQQSWRRVAQQLSDAGLQKADITAKIKDLDFYARQGYALANDAEGYAEYKRVLRVAQAHIDKLVDPSTSKLRRAYQDVIDATVKASGATMDNAIKYAAYFKERYNSERIARTEMARAYGQGFFSEGIADGDVIGWKAHLSDAHHAFDICDFHVRVDLYGMGDGVYPISQGPEYPFHPNCTCVLTYVYSGETDVSTNMENGQAKKFLLSLPKGKAAELLGVQGYKNFQDDHNSWADNLKNWNGHQPITATVPVSVLHGTQK